MATEPETPSPDVMEVWREARRAWRSGPAIVRDEETNSVRIGDREAAATVIAEAKARWLAEKEAEIARLRGVVAVADDAIREMFRYYDGGEMRGSYDGKPERAQLRKAGYATSAALKEPSQ